MSITEPPSSYTAGVESTVYRGMLSESYCLRLSPQEGVLIHCMSWNAFGVIVNHKREMQFRIRLNPLCIVECFRSGGFMILVICLIVLIHCISWSAFGAQYLSTIVKNKDSLNPLYVVECFRSVQVIMKRLIAICLNPLCIVECFRRNDFQSFQGY